MSRECLCLELHLVFVLTTRPGASSFATDNEVKAVAQTYVIGQEIKGMTFTTSRSGITVKDLIREQIVFPVSPGQFIDTSQFSMIKTKSRQSQDVFLILVVQLALRPRATRKRCSSRTTQCCLSTLVE